MKILRSAHSINFMVKAVFLTVLTVFVSSGPVFSQSEDLSAGQSSKFFETQMRAANSRTLVSGRTKIYLWGVDEIDVAGAAFKLKARTALDNTMGGKPVRCEIKARVDSKIFAQCVNDNDLDLGLFMLQQGYVTADRAAVYSSVFEDAYIQAEMEAQDRGLGIWDAPDSQGGSGSSDGTLMLSFSFILFLCIIAAFTTLSIIIMRGFQKVIKAQNRNMSMMAKERKLREKERNIIAVMVDSEIKANKAKIEAYLVVYEEMLKALKDPDRPPKYKKAGDIVQKQPALDRSVFDRNTDKLDLLGRDLASEMIHFYARIKSSPEYENLEPDMELEQVTAIVEDVVKRGGRLNELAEKLLGSIESSGLTS